MFLTSAMRRVPAIEAALLLMAEPVLSPVWAWLAHGEAVAGWALAGGCLILAATGFSGLYDAFLRRSSEVP
jgi:drug/metabolite transporter (DMT)-like permease